MLIQMTTSGNRATGIPSNRFKQDVGLQKGARLGSYYRLAPERFGDGNRRTKIRDQRPNLLFPGVELAAGQHYRSADTAEYRLLFSNFPPAVP